MQRTVAPSLTLVDALPASVHAARVREVAEANKAASALPPLTAQALLAANVTGSLEGGEAAVLPAEARRRLIASAARLGIREFDAHLIIAMVQERARGVRSPEAGQPAQARPRSSPESSHQISDSASPVQLLALAVLLAAALFGSAVLWLR